MSEQHDDEPRAEHAAEPAPRDRGDDAANAQEAHPAGGAGQANPAAGAPPDEPAAGGALPPDQPRPATEHRQALPPPSGPPAGPSSPGRFRRWSGRRPVQLVAVGLLTGLIGGVAGGAIVAAFDDDGGGQKAYVRPNGTLGRGYGFRAPYPGLPPGGRWAPPRIHRMPMRPSYPSSTPAPLPSLRPAPTPSG